MGHPPQRTRAVFCWEGDIDPGAVNTICKSGNTGDSTQEYQGGDVYLDVNSEAAWIMFTLMNTLTTYPKTANQHPAHKVIN